MDASDYAAWYAAIVATLVLVWDIIKWRKTGPQILAEANAGYKSFGIPDLEGQDLTIVKVTNTGDRPTTITHMGMYWAPKGASVKDKSKRQAFIVPGGLAGFGQIPQKIEPGDVWTGLIKENDEYKRMRSSGRLVVMLAFSHSKDDVLVDIEAPANKPMEPPR